MQAVTVDGMVLRWTDNSSDETAFELYRPERRGRLYFARSPAAQSHRLRGWRGVPGHGVHAYRLRAIGDERGLRLEQ